MKAVVHSATQTEVSAIVPEGATSGPVTVIVNENVLRRRGPDFIISGIEGMPMNFKIAFIGDSHIGIDEAAVLNLIKNEGADAVVHPGDLNYG